MKNLFKSIIYCFYLFIIVGLLFHTSSTPQLFGKYTYKYFAVLIVLVLVFIPFTKLVNYIIITSKVRFRNKKYIVNPYKKIIISFIIFIFFILIPAEITLRVMHINFKSNPNVLTIKNFHPFLQHKMDQSNNLRDPNIHINSFGFRGEEIDKKKQENVYRIFVLGGSTVLNRNVSYEKSFERLLEIKLKGQYQNKRIEVLNAGADGYTSEHSLIDFMFNIKDFDPDMIIVLQGINDMTTSCSPIGYSYGGYKPDYSHSFGSISNIIFTYFQDEPLISIHSVFMEEVGMFIKYNLYSDLISVILSKQKEVLPTKPIDNVDFPSIQSYNRNLNYLIQLTKENNVKLMLINQPTRYSKKENDTVWFAQRTCSTETTHPSVSSLQRGISIFNEATRKTAEQNSVQFIDLDSQIPKNTKYIVDDAHFTENGNKLISDIIYKYLVGNELIK
jgi:lysophospholipase L1-like esterase